MEPVASSIGCVALLLAVRKTTHKVTYDAALKRYTMVCSKTYQGRSMAKYNDTDQCQLANVACIVRNS